jgi:endonuclease G
MNKFLFLSLVPFAVLANPIDDLCPQFTLRGAPVSQQPNTIYLCKQNYALNYRSDTKTAEYVVEHITLESITGPAKRADDFRADPGIPVEYQSQLSDYAGHPYDRGHLASAADNTQNPALMSESFFLSNMVPQNPNNNRGIWRQLEIVVRNLVKEGKDLYVISGTIYNPGYLTIGTHHVGVPTHLWKIIVDKQGKGVAFLFPNAPAVVKELPNYATSIREIEKYTGINFMPQLTESQAVRIEEYFDVTEWLVIQ